MSDGRAPETERSTSLKRARSLNRGPCLNRTPCLHRIPCPSPRGGSLAVSATPPMMAAEPMERGTAPRGAQPMRQEEVA